MYQYVGTCSLCGGQVMGVRGAWMSVSPPPPDRCSFCGAVSSWDVINMRHDKFPSYTPCPTCGRCGPHYCTGTTGQADGWTGGDTFKTPVPHITREMVKQALHDADSDPREGQTYADQLAESLNKQLIELKSNQRRRGTLE